MSAERAAQLIDAGIWLKLSGDLEGARRLFERAAKLDPDNARARELLAQGPAEVTAPVPTTPAPPAENPFERVSSPSAVDGDWGAAMGGEHSPAEVPWAEPVGSMPLGGVEAPGRTMMMFSAPAIEPATPMPPASTPFDSGEVPPSLDDLPLAVPTTPFAMVPQAAPAPVPEPQQASAPPEPTLEGNWGQIAAPGEAVQEPLELAPAPAVTPSTPSRSTMVYSGSTSGTPFSEAPAPPRSTMVFSGSPVPASAPRTTMMFTGSPVPAPPPLAPPVAQPDAPPPASAPRTTMMFSPAPPPLEPLPAHTDGPARSTMVFSATTAGPMPASAVPEVQKPMVIAIGTDDSFEEPISIVDSLRSQVDAARARPPASMKSAPPMFVPSTRSPVPSPPSPVMAPAAASPQFVAPPAPVDPSAAPIAEFSAPATLPAATVVLTDRKPEPTLPTPTPPMFAESDLLPPLPKVDAAPAAKPLPVDDAWNWSSSQPANLAPRPSPALSPEASSAWDQRSNPGIKIDDIAAPPSKALEFVSSSSKITRPPEVSKADEVALLLRGARDLIDLDDHTGAMELIVKAEALAPTDPEVVSLRERSEKTLLAMFESKLGHLDKLPRVLLKDDEIIWLNLDHRAGFVLAQIDGSVTFEDLFAVSGMSRIDTARILAQLVDEGVISRG